MFCPTVLTFSRLMPAPEAPTVALSVASPMTFSTPVLFAVVETAPLMVFPLPRLTTAFCPAKAMVPVSPWFRCAVPAPVKARLVLVVPLKVPTPPAMEVVGEVSAASKVPVPAPIATDALAEALPEKVPAPVPMDSVPVPRLCWKFPVPAPIMTSLAVTACSKVLSPLATFTVEAVTVPRKRLVPVPLFSTVLAKTLWSKVAAPPVAPDRTSDSRELALPTGAATFCVPPARTS